MGGCRCCWPVVVPSALVWMGALVATVPVVCIKGLWYRPLPSRTPMRMGLPLHVMSTSSSLNTVTPVLVKTDMVPLLKVLPMLIYNVGKFWKVFACLARTDSLGNGSWVTCLAWLLPPLATPTIRVDGCRMRRPALMQSFLLR
jgi:hypothetical protein